MRLDKPERTLIFRLVIDTVFEGPAGNRFDFDSPFPQFPLDSLSAFPLIEPAPYEYLGIAAIVDDAISLRALDGIIDFRLGKPVLRETFPRGFLGPVAHVE